MATYNILEAKTHLSRLIECVPQGEDVVIAKAGEPAVRLLPIAKEKAGRRQFGQDFPAEYYVAPDAYGDLPLDTWKCLDGEDDNVCK